MNLKFDRFLKEMKSKNVAVLGVGVSNTPLIKLLLSAGAHVTACDKKDRASFGELADTLEATGAKLKLGEGYLDGLEQDVIFRTPGMRPDIPQLIDAGKRGAEITSEMEAFFKVCPCRIIAVTGSDGKTTTTTLIYELLKAQGHASYVGGNIGSPLLSLAGQMKETDTAVLELSSFQLMTMKQSPDIAVVTNVSPNHLDIHKSMEEYIEAKRQIFLHQDQNGVLAVNYDNEITRSFLKQARGKTVPFSRKDELDEGVFVCGEDIISRLGGKEERVLSVKDILIPGAHNVENYMAAIAATRGLALNETVQGVAKSFPGVEHRIELTRTLRGVRYYNSSIDSSPTRTAAALRSFNQRVIVICGGHDKKIPFEPLGEVLVEKAKAVVLTGATAEKIEKTLTSTPGFDPKSLPVIKKPDFKEAVLAASSLACEGDAVILSPACASFDSFPNFIERGRRFKEIINSLG